MVVEQATGIPSDSGAAFTQEQEFTQIAERGRLVTVKEGILGRQFTLTGKSDVSFYPSDRTWDPIDPSDRPILKRAKEARERLRVDMNMYATPPLSHTNAVGNVTLYEEDGVQRAILNIDKITWPSWQYPNLTIDDLDGLALLGEDNSHRITDIVDAEWQAHIFTVDTIGSHWSIYVEYDSQPHIFEQKVAEERAAKYQELLPKLEFTTDSTINTLVKLPFARGGQMLFHVIREDGLRAYVHEQVGGGYEKTTTVEDLETFLGVIRLSPDAKSLGIVDITEEVILNKIQEKALEYSNLAKNAVDVYNRVSQSGEK